MSSPAWVKPLPWGHSVLYSADPGAGHGEQGLPQPMVCEKVTEQQQQVDLDTAFMEGLIH